MASRWQRQRLDLQAAPSWSADIVTFNAALAAAAAAVVVVVDIDMEPTELDDPIEVAIAEQWTGMQARTRHLTEEEAVPEMAIALRPTTAHLTEAAMALLLRSPLSTLLRTTLLHLFLGTILRTHTPAVLLGLLTRTTKLPPPPHLLHMPLHNLFRLLNTLAIHHSMIRTTLLHHIKHHPLSLLHLATTRHACFVSYPSHPRTYHCHRNNTHHREAESDSYV